MRRATLDKYRQQLQQLSSRVRSTVSNVADQTKSPASGQGTGELSPAPLHLADVGTEEFMHELNSTLLENEEYLAREITEALARLDAGSFGVCMSCEQEIAAERLNALPYTRYCVSCAANASDVPGINLNKGRPVHPNDTIAPEGEMNEDLREPLEDTVVSPHDRSDRYAPDIHAAGTAGGGTAIGGLAGSNIGRGDPKVADLQDATGSGDFDAMDSRHHNPDLPRTRRGRSRPTRSKK